MLALSGCGSDGGAAAGKPTPTPTPSAPTVTSDACRAYDRAIAMLSKGLDGADHVPFVIVQFGPPAAEKIRTAAQLAPAGQGRTAMESSATKIQVLVDAGGVDDGPETRAVKDSIGAVDRMCRDVGASLSNLPAPS
jgi:hypothetical protein